jgi:hypothetical protein
VVSAAVAVLLGWLTFPGSYEAPSTGLDPSWIIGLNIFSRSGIRFGRDVIFTYGPLGYIVRPLDVSNHLLLGNLARVGLHLALFATVGYLLWRRHRLSSILLFLALLPLTVAVGREFDYEILGVACLVLAVAVTCRIGWPLVPVAVVLATVPMMKFGTGLCAVATLSWAVVLWLRGGGSWRWPAAAAAAFALVSCALARYFFGDVQGTFRFLRRSAEIASGYNDAMVVIGAPGQVQGAVAVVLLVLVALALMPRRSSAGMAVLLQLIVLAYAFKHSFVRQDSHAVIILAVLIWLGCVAVLLSGSRREQGLSLLIVAATLIVLVSTSSSADVRQRREGLGDVLSGGHGSRNISSLVRFRVVRDELRSRGASALSGDVLPSEWVDLVGRRPVMVLPWEIAVCLANGLNCQPIPTLQLYSTYTRGLDRWSAARIRETKPEFVVLGLASLDDRNMLWDCPETWMAILEGYAVLRTESTKGLLLLQRRVSPRRWREVPLAEVKASSRSWLTIPERTGPVRVSILSRERPSGTLRRLLFRPAPAVLEVSTMSGETRAYRLVLNTAEDGLLIDAMPQTIEDLAKLFDCCAVPERVRAVRLAGPGLAALDPDIRVVWSSLQTDRGLEVRPALALPHAVEVSGEPMLAIDRVNGTLMSSSKKVPIDSGAEAILTVSGWAVDPQARAPAAAVILRVDGGRQEFRAEYGSLREDVARHFGIPGYARSGFRSSIALDQIGTGEHRLQISVVSNDGRTSQLSSQTIQLDVR